MTPQRPQNLLETDRTMAWHAQTDTEREAIVPPVNHTSSGTLLALTALTIGMGIVLLML